MPLKMPYSNVLINCNYVSVYVRLGELDSRTNLCDNNRNLCSEPQDYEIESVVHHSSYDMPKYANDIALIRLRNVPNTSK